MFDSSPLGGNILAAPPPPPPRPGMGRAPPSPSQGGPAPPPPPPPNLGGGTSKFKMVTGLGEALHQAKLKLTGHKETPASAEGVSIGPERQVSATPSPRVAGSRPKSWHAGAQKNRAVISEMQSKLAARRAKVDKEAEVCISNGTAPSPTPQDYSGGRKYSQESLDSCGSYIREASGTPSVDGFSYRRVSVDAERKEELMLAKQVRQNSVKILSKSPLPYQIEPGIQNSRPKPDFSTPQTEITPPSSVVMRYWNQCSSSEVDGSTDNNGSDSGNETENIKTSTEEEPTPFPSIKNKIKDIETGKLVTSVPDVKKNLKLDDYKPAEWMETRKKLQAQLDVLLNRTTTKISNITTTSQDKVEEDSSDAYETAAEEDNEAQADNNEINTHQVNQEVKTLIKSVAHEIQKSFSKKNFDEDAFNDDVESDQEEVEDSNTDIVEYNKVEIEEINPPKPEEPVLEAPVDFDSVPVVLDSSINKGKISVIRKSSVERRAPSSTRRSGILARRQNRAAVITELLAEKICDDRASPLPKLLLNTEDGASHDNEKKAEFLAKEMAQLESSQVVNILQSIEKGVLDCSLPLLIPFLSLQVKLAMSKNIISGLDSENKKEVIRDSMLESLLNDITDIAILQEVIDRSQEKLNALTDINKTITKIDASTLTDDTLLLKNTNENQQDKFNDINKGKRDSGIVTDLSSDKDDASVTNDESEQNTSKDIIDLSEHIETEIMEAMEQSEKESKIDSTTKSSKDEKDSSAKSSKEESRRTTPSPADTPTNEPDNSEDSGVDVEENVKEKIKENDLSKSKSEKDIKNKIMNILNDAKAQDDSKKKTRNFGRNFEFQMPNLKPVIPNDRRPAKVRRMDDLWTKQVATRTGNWGMLEAPAPKPAQKVPWSKKKEAETVKRDSIMKNEEVDEFEKCRTALSDHKAGKKISMVESPAKSSSKTEEDENTSRTEITDTKEKEDNTANILNQVESKKSKTNKDKTVEKTNLATESVKIESQKVQIDSIDANPEKVEITERVDDIELDENNSDTEKESINTTTANETKTAKLKNDCISKKDEVKTDDNVKEKAIITITDKKPPAVPTAAALSPAIPTPAALSPAVPTAASLSPVVPRRRDISAPSLPPPTSSPRVPSTPPPSRKPPPPPISPPPTNKIDSTQSMLETTTVRFHELQKEFSNGLKTGEKDIAAKESPTVKDDRSQVKEVQEIKIEKKDVEESEDESEWEEWTEEETDYSEDEEEEISKVATIAEDSSTTSYSAEFCIRL